MLIVNNNVTDKVDKVVDNVLIGVGTVNITANVVGSCR